MSANVLILFITFTSAVFSFNIDTKFPIIKQSKNSGKTYFGYSVHPHKILRDNSFRILVGAPMDNMTNYMSTQRPSGAVYSCPITSATSDCRQVLMLKLSSQPGLRNLYPNQWLGVHVLSDTVTKGGQYAYTCAHRFMQEKSFTRPASILAPGQCMALPNSLRSNLVRLMPLSPRGCPTPGYGRSTGMCLRGTGLASRPDLGVLALGAANEQRGAGAVHYSRHRPQPGRDRWNRTRVRRGDSLQGSYAGYSVALGRIYADRPVNFTLAAGAPGVPDDKALSAASWAEEGRGQVRLYAVTERTERTEVRAVLRGDQFGSRFGHAVLALDITGDGWDDLIVGAPDFNERPAPGGTEAGQVGSGAVYVFINEEGSTPQQRTLRRILVLRPRALTRTECPGAGQCADAQFGSALGGLGDLNMDGLQDVGIGAPGEGGGVVYVYHGHRLTGLSKKPSQVLIGIGIDKRLRGFGTSLGGGLDVDGNHYPDVVIGAPLSGHAVILRTRPVINVLCAVVFEPAELDPALQPTPDLFACGADGLCLRARVYLSYRHAGAAADKAAKKELSRKNSYSALVRLELEGRRIVFESGATTSLKRKLQLYHADMKSSPLLERLYIDPKRRFMDKMRPIRLRVSWQLNMMPPGASDRLPNLDHYPTYNNASASKTFLLPWRRTCLQPTCVSDLSLRMKTSLQRSPGKFVFYLGRENNFWLNFSIANKAEPAHKTALSLEFTNRLVLLDTRCPLGCKWRNWRLRCPIANPLRKNANASCAIRLSGSDIFPEVPRLDFRISLLTISDNLNASRTNISFSASVQILANVRMTSVVEPDMVSYGGSDILGFPSILHEKKIGSRVTFTVSLENSAKTGVVPVSFLTIYWPYEVAGSSSERHGKYLLYMTRPPWFETAWNNTLRCQPSAWSDLVNPNGVRLLSLSPGGGGKRKSVARTFSYTVGGPKSASGYELCSDGLARCRPIRCRVERLSRKTGPVLVRIEARLWVHTLTEDFPEVSQVPVRVNVTWRPDPRYTVTQLHGNDTSVLMRLVALNTMVPPPSSRPDNMWMIVSLSVLGGVILLGCIILLLWKMKFFARDRRIEEHRLAQQQQMATEEDELHRYDYMEDDY